jgi:hypothetical protein
MSEPDMELTGDPDGKPHRDIDPATGQQRAYVVLSEEERAKGFVEPVRRSYVHVGPPKPEGLRELTEEEKMRYEGFGYAMFQPYDDDDPVVGKFWTQDELDRVGGCGGKTTVAQNIAETYARDPEFYGGTFCATCREHFPIGEKGEFVWDGTDQRVGTRSQQ